MITKQKYIKTLVLTVRAEGQEKDVTILGSKVQLENQNGKNGNIEYFFLRK
jgi:hypothetical protein